MSDKLNYRDTLFKNYNRTHVAYLDGEDQSKIAWFLRYADKYYRKHIMGYDRTSTTILEIGCNKGYLLYVLKHWGFEKIYGIDLSKDDLEKAKKIVPMAHFSCEDAFTYLHCKDVKFDIVILKAVLEHIQKENILSLLEMVRDNMAQNGTVIIDVPNMDWLFAQHERYMDFTHEVGFTRESLAQVMRSVFPDVKIYSADNIIFTSLIQNYLKKISRFVLGKILTWADSEGASNPIWHRSIVGVGKK